MSRELKDFPAMLKASLVAESLGQALYYAQVEAWGGSTAHWSGLPSEVRLRYRIMAKEIVLRLRPVAVTTGLRPTHGNIVGQIEPRGMR